MERGDNPFDKQKRGSRIVVSPKEKRTEDGIVFASAWEKRVYVELRNAFGKDAFQLQPRFVLQPKFRGADGVNHREIAYVADFLFGPKRKDKSSPITGEHVVIDAKGMKDAVFKIKHKMFVYQYGQPLYLPSRVRDVKELVEFIKAKYGL